MYVALTDAVPLLNVALSAVDRVVLPLAVSLNAKSPKSSIEMSVSPSSSQ